MSAHSICHNSVGFALFKELGNSMKSNNKWSYGVVLLACAVVCTTAYAATTATTVVAAQDPASAPGNALGDTSARRSLLTNGPADEPQVQGNGNITELQHLIRDGKVVEMRTTSNSSYSATPLFSPDQIFYSCAL